MLEGCSMSKRVTPYISGYSMFDRELCRVWKRAEYCLYGAINDGALNIDQDRR